MTNTAKTQVINLALSHLGEPGFDDIEVTPTPPKLAKVFAQLDMAELYVLRRHNWLCALTYAEIDASTASGNWKYPYVYDLPLSYVRMTEVATFGPHQVVSQVDGGTGAVTRQLLHSSAGPVQVAYIERKPFEAYDSDLLNALAFELAARCAGPIQDNVALGEKLHQKAVEMMGQAMSAEHGEEGDQDPVVLSPLLALRRLAG